MIKFNTVGTNSDFNKDSQIKSKNSGISKTIVQDSFEKSFEKTLDAALFPDSCSEILNFRPKSILHAQKGRSYVEKGENELASKHFKKAIRLLKQDKTPNTHSLAVYAFLKSQKYFEEGKENYILAKKVKDVEIKTLLLNLAKIDFEKSWKQDETNKGPYGCMAVMEYELGNTQKAKEMLKIVADKKLEEIAQRWHKILTEQK